jgi:hypothetical protein
MTSIENKFGHQYSGTVETDLYNLEELEMQAIEFLPATISAFPKGGAKNPFAEPAEGRAQHAKICSHVLGVSSEDDEPFILEDELEDDLFAEEKTKSRR